MCVKVSNISYIFILLFLLIPLIILINLLCKFNMAAEQITEYPKNPSEPEKILLFSGKRKSGKDFITDILHERIGPERCAIVRLSAPIKTHWSKALGLDIQELLGNGEYKEKYRLEMAKWGEDIRKQDYGYFCRAAVDMYNAWNKPIWIISDARRKTDILWFQENFGEICKTIRVNSDEKVRKNRGWVYTPGIDDAETECDLDDTSVWDLQVENNDENVEPIIQQILELIR